MAATTGPDARPGTSKPYSANLTYYCHPIRTPVPVNSILPPQRERQVVESDPTSNPSSLTHGMCDFQQMTYLPKPQFPHLHNGVDDNIM